MKKFLPKTTNNPQGFTLVELLVVISIIAVLSVIGMTVYGNVQRNARNVKRTQEIKAIANALEVNKTATGYQTLLASNFAGNVFPGGSATQALDPQLNAYCIQSNNTGAAITDAVITGWTGVTCPSGYAIVSTSTPTANHTTWKVCTLIEGTTNTVTCQGNSQ